MPSSFSARKQLSKKALLNSPSAGPTGSVESTITTSRLPGAALAMYAIPSSNRIRARGSPLDSHSSGKYFSAMRVTCSSMSHCTACSTPGCRSTSRSVPQSPPPMITTRFGSGWVNSAGCDIIS